MEVDVANSQDEEGGGPAGARTRMRRARKWAVDVQPATVRPTSCNLCGIPFATDQVRLCTWGERTTSRWKCLGCLAGLVPARAELAPVGRATPEHAAAARENLNQARAHEAAAGPQGDNASPDEDAGEAQRQWEALELPGRGWWARLSLQEALRLGVSSFVQVPDRLRGAVVTARQRTLETYFTALDGGSPATEECKAVLLFDFLLLSKGRGQASCAELLEERLAWWSGGQWATLWASAAEQTPPPAATTPTANKKRCAARVHTLASAGEEGRALSAATSAQLAPRTQQILAKVRACFPENPPEAAAPQTPRRPSLELLAEVEEEA